MTGRWLEKGDSLRTKLDSKSWVCRESLIEISSFPLPSVFNLWVSRFLVAERYIAHSLLKSAYMNNDNHRIHTLSFHSTTIRSIQTFFKTENTRGLVCWAGNHISEPKSWHASLILLHCTELE